ncbi:MAG TPA: CopG family transcriptional regulator [Cyanobacteria bacterium UBA11149]|nr:CopG family transcriptional regulator [Cyanobacteria bacterium UBA11367]HBE59524.1 CopG family transcriptional regulator [Cyanobacteria bacterium UBA11366]HBK66911.1 CopG family transcriptional regulator [Cyanobacteria bacterium UBA11166]HBR73693.1 CopG family transcriptional regulator [Cyanobacteria bacterium UBA11159]HBS72536.1 CopG family transcriptional regulator [Cyanobacteria bacterium UBA11153]HBW87314.1 CopG family transcriptional regulator [Cyanobacteria bacterium UBA11149]HCA9646
MKNRRLSIKLTNYELQELKEESERRGMTQSELLRSLIARFPLPSFKAD